MGSVLNVPLKSVLPYHMDDPGEEIPEGWVVPIGQTLSASQQDINPGGTYVCPDLRNYFLIWGDPGKGVGVGGTSVDAASGAPGPKGFGGSHTASLSVAQLPAHTHSLNRQIAFWDIQGQPEQGYIINVRDDITHTETTNSTGSGQNHENRPRYYALVPIMRVKK